MPYKHLDILSNAPYRDDFDATKNFLQVLFRPGYAVQARELTQLQTILQNQISKVGDHLFLDGTHVYGAKISSSNYYFARIENISLQSGGAVSTINVNTFKNKCFCPTQIKFKNDATVYNTRNSATPSPNDIDALEKDMQIEIVDVLEQTSSDDWIIIFKINKGSFQILDHDLSNSVDFSTQLVFSEITTGPSGGNVNTFKTFSNIANSNAAPIKFSFKQRQLSGSTVLVENTNQVLCVGISAGIFYKDGRFIQTPNTFIPLYKLSEGLSSNSFVEIESTMYESNSTVTYNSNLVNKKLFSYPSKKVGFEITYTSITETEDPTLLDNANGFTNLNAPGAARLKATVTTVSEKFDPNNPESYKSKTIAGNDFIELVRYKKGVIQSIKEETEYNEILRLFAGRTYDESGSYTVNPFKLEIKEHLKRDTYTITFTGELASSVEVGDMVFKKVLTSGGIAASPRLDDLIFPSATKTGGQKYPTEFSEPIGIVKSSNNNQITVEMLNSYSFTGLAAGTTISRQSNDTGTITDINGTTTTVIFVPDIQGLYTLGDTPTGDEDKAAILVNPGKGYIEGFKVENYNSSIIDLPKGRSVDHQVSDTSTIDFTTQENVLYMKLGEDFATSTGPLTNTYINIEADSSSVAAYFAGPTINDYADATVLSWSPFEEGNLVNSNTSNSILPLLNKESVLFVTSEKAPILPQD